MAFEEYEILLASGKCKGQFSSDNASWKINPDYVLIISGTGTSGDYYGDDLHPWLAYQDKIVKVVLEEGITSAGMYSFTNMVSLAEVVLPSTLWSIDQQAFHNCPSLTSITIPAATKYLRERCFGDWYITGSEYDYNYFYLTNVVFERTSGWTHRDPLNSSDSVSVLASQLQNPADAAEMLRNHFNRYFVNTEAS